jgi:hypothetical protein
VVARRLQLAIDADRARRNHGHRQLGRLPGELTVNHPTNRHRHRPQGKARPRGAGEPVPGRWARLPTEVNHRRATSCLAPLRRLTDPRAPCMHRSTDRTTLRSVRARDRRDRFARSKD